VAGFTRDFPAARKFSITGDAQAELGRRNAVPKQELGNEKKRRDSSPLVRLRMTDFLTENRKLGTENWHLDV
jgi:hypothetical protein